MSSTATLALITHSWTHITSVDIMLRQTSCRGRELWIFSGSIWSMRPLNAPSHRERFSGRNRMANASDIFPVRRETKHPGAYMGKLLRVNLTTGSLKDEILPEEPLLRKLIGGQAL